MKIKLKGELHPELTRFGLKPGDIVEGRLQSTNKAVYFTVYRAVPQDCVVYPDNYDIVQPTEQPKLPLEYSFETGV